MPGRPRLELELWLWPFELAARASAMRVPSQTAGLVSTSKKPDLTPLQTQKNYLCRPVPELKPLAHSLLPKMYQVRRCLIEVPPLISGREGNGLFSSVLGCFPVFSSVLGCVILIDFLLLGYFGQSICPLDSDAIYSTNWSIILVNAMTLTTTE